MNASTALLQALLARGDYLEQFSRDELTRLAAILDAAHTEVLGKVALAGGTWTQAQLAELAADLDAIYQQAMREAYDEARPRLEKLAVDEGAWVEATTKQIAMGVSFSLPAPSLLRAVLDLPTNIGGSTLAHMFEALGVNTREAAYKAIQAGMLEGDTIDQMTRRLRGKVVKRAAWKTDPDGVRRYHPGVYQGGALEDVSTRQAEALARTATMHVGNKAREAFYGENEDIIKGYQRIETLDINTCLICGDPAFGDGHVYKPDEPRPALPIHPSCRGLYVPVMKSWRELGIDANELPEGTRASMDGQVAESKTWADMLAEARAKGDTKRMDEMLGPTRAALYMKGMPLSDMVQGGEVVPIKDLPKVKPKKENAA